MKRVYYLITAIFLLLTLFLSSCAKADNFKHPLMENRSLTWGDSQSAVEKVFGKADLEEISAGVVTLTYENDIKTNLGTVSGLALHLGEETDRPHGLYDMTFVIKETTFEELEKKISSIYGKNFEKEHFVQEEQHWGEGSQYVRYDWTSNMLGAQSEKAQDTYRNNCEKFGRPISDDSDQLSLTTIMVYGVAEGDKYDVAVFLSGADYLYMTFDQYRK